MSDEQTTLTTEEKTQKIDSLRDMISSAEKTIQGAKAMLLQIEGKKKVGRKRKIENEEDGQVVQGVFDGQVMIGSDGKQYPVPANYASKSKLVEGDLLKLTITPEGFFLYKQVGPVARQNKIGIVSLDSSGNHTVVAEGKVYKVLLASITYFKANPGDEVVIVAPQDEKSEWASLENVLQHSGEAMPIKKHASLPEQPVQKPMTATGLLTGDLSGEPEPTAATEAEESAQTIVDEWVPDIDEIEKEIRQEMGIKTD